LVKPRGSFLTALWQVEGAAVGLSLAVVLFAFQAVYGRRRAATLSEFAEETWLFPILFLGLLGLVIDGVVLLGGGRDAPDGWAATWVTVWALATAASLAWLFVRTVRALEPHELQQRRLERIDRAVRREVEDLILRRVANNQLGTFLKTTGIGSEWDFGRDEERTTPIFPRRDGEVQDIKLNLLRRAAAHAERHSTSRPRLRVHLGSRVRTSTQIATAGSDQQHGRRALSRAVKVRRRDPRDFRRRLDDLHEEALAAISTPSPTVYEDITELYERIFLALPETWARYGADYRKEIAGGASLFELTAHEHLERRLYEEMTLAAKSQSRDVAHDALDLPIQIAQGALELRGLALTQRMLVLWVAARRALLSSADAEETRNLLSWSWLRLDEYSRRPSSLIENGPDIQSQDLGREALLQVFEAFAQSCKAILDLRPTDTELLAEVLEHFASPLSHWRPEQRGPYEWDVQGAVRRGDDADTIARLQSELEEKQRLVAIKQELEDWRELHRFGLLFWVVRSVRNSGDIEQWLPAWNALRGYFSDPGKLLGIVAKGLDEAWQDTGPWSRWVIDARHSGRASFGAIDIDFLETYIVLALGITSPDVGALNLSPHRNVVTQLDDPRARVKAIVQRDALRPLLPEDRLDERADKLITAFEQMKEQQAHDDEQATLNAVIDDERIAAFETELRDAWRESRQLSTVIPAPDVVGEDDGCAPDDAGAFWSQWFNKEWFLADSTIVGMDDAAKDAGRSLADWEWISLLRHSTEAPQTIAARTVADTVRQSIAELAAAGYTASLIVVPLIWDLFSANDLQWLPNRGGDAQTPEWLVGSQLNHAFLGFLDGVPVVEEYASGHGEEIPPHLIHVIDLERLARFREWRISTESDALNFEAQTFDEARAIDAVDNDRIRFDEAITRDEKIRQLQVRVRLTARYAFDIEVVDSAASRTIRVPDELHH